MYLAMVNCLFHPSWVVRNLVSETRFIPFRMLFEDRWKEQIIEPLNEIYQRREMCGAI